jgi:hypothetical protein
LEVVGGWGLLEVGSCWRLEVVGGWKLEVGRCVFSGSV